MRYRFVRFLASGGSAAIVEYLLFIVLQVLLGHRWLLINQPISFLAGFVTSFILNREWVFRSAGAVHVELFKYGLIAMANLVCGEALIAILSVPLRINPYISKIIVMAIIAGWNYVLFSRVVFKSRSTNS